MGLMTETPWEAALSVNSMSHSNVDYHRENLKQLKKMQQMAKMKKEAEANKPMKAFGLPADLTEANKKKFDHVQSKVQEWVVSTNTNGGGGSGRESKNFLKGHARTGPFLENGDNDSAIQIRRLSGLKANMASKDKLQVINRFMRVQVDFTQKTPSILICYWLLLKIFAKYIVICNFFNM